MFLLTYCFFFFFNATATTEIYTLSLHDALPIARPPAFRRPVAQPPEPARSSLLHQGRSPRPLPVSRPGGLDEALDEPTGEGPRGENILATSQHDRPAQIPTGVPDVPGHPRRHVQVPPVEMLSIEGPLPHAVAVVQPHLIRSSSPRSMCHHHRRQIPDRNPGAEEAVPQIVVLGGR